MRKIFCPNCGTQLRINSLVCSKCGVSSITWQKELSTIRFLGLKPFNGSATYGLPTAFASLLFLSIFSFTVGGTIIGLIENGLMRSDNRLARDAFAGVGGVAIGIGVLILVLSLICFVTWFYQMWNLIPNEFQTYSPAVATALLFVPIFNLYWMFQVLPGLSRRLFQAQAKYDPRHASEAGYGLAIVVCIGMCIPYLNVLAVCLCATWVFVANNAGNRLVHLRSLDTLHNCLDGQNFPSDKCHHFSVNPAQSKSQQIR